MQGYFLKVILTTHFVNQMLSPQLLLYRVWFHAICDETFVLVCNFISFVYFSNVLYYFFLKLVRNTLLSFNEKQLAIRVNYFKSYNQCVDITPQGIDFTPSWCRSYPHCSLDATYLSNVDGPGKCVPFDA